MTDFKPMLTVPEQIARMKEKGITFELFSEEDAAEYLEMNNNYFKVTSYRRNYDKHLSGKSAGRYIGLDFAYLRDLAIIDMKLRYSCIQLSLDVEHYAKMELLRQCVAHREDGYQICRDFELSLSESQQNLLSGEIARNRDSAYCGGIVNKYGVNGLPVWAFLEMIPFGRLVSFYRYCAASRYNDRQMKTVSYLLQTCQRFRNACAHNSCVLNDLRANSSLTSVSRIVLNRLSRTDCLSRGTIEKRMSNVRINQVITLLYTHSLLVTSTGMHSKAAVLLNDFDARMTRNLEYYSGNEMIRSSFLFLHNVIQSWFPA